MILDLVYAASFVAYWGIRDSVQWVEEQVVSRYYSEQDMNADADVDENEDHKKRTRRSTQHEGADPLEGKATVGDNNALENALDFLLLFQKYCVQGAGPTEERLEREERERCRTEAIEKVRGWKTSEDPGV